MKTIDCKQINNAIAYYGILCCEYIKLDFEKEKLRIRSGKE
jgi:hypothetical protein